MNINLELDKLEIEKDLKKKDSLTGKKIFFVYGYDKCNFPFILQSAFDF